VREQSYRRTPRAADAGAAEYGNAVAVDRRMIDKVFHFNIGLSLSRS